MIPSGAPSVIPFGDPVEHDANVRDHERVFKDGGRVAMRPYEYVRADDPAAAVALVSADPQAEYLAGGTTELDSS